MLLKTLIMVLLIALIASLASGLVFLMKDVGTTRRTLHALGLRIALAIALMTAISYGFFSGQLKVGAPWDRGRYGPETEQPDDDATRDLPDVQGETSAATQRN